MGMKDLSVEKLSKNFMNSYVLIIIIGRSKLLYTRDELGIVLFYLGSKMQYLNYVSYLVVHPLDAAS